MPPLISTLLDHPATFVVARVILTTLFWSEVILGITNFPAFVEAMNPHSPSKSLISLS